VAFFWVIKYILCPRTYLSKCIKKKKKGVIYWYLSRVVCILCHQFFFFGRVAVLQVTSFRSFFFAEKTFLHVLIFTIEKIMYFTRNFFGIIFVRSKFCTVFFLIFLRAIFVLFQNFFPVSKIKMPFSREYFGGPESIGQRKFFGYYGRNILYIYSICFFIGSVYELRCLELFRHSVFLFVVHYYKLYVDPHDVKDNARILHFPNSYNNCLSNAKSEKIHL